VSAHRGSFGPIARLTVVEIPRQPALLLLVTTLILFIGCLPFLITHNLGEPGKLVRDSAMAVMFLGSLLLSATAACGAVSREIRRGTAGAILSKPISRTRFLAAKYAGVSVIMLVFAGMCTLAILLADRAAARSFQIGWEFLIPLYLAVFGAYVLAGLINYTTRRPFASTAFWCLAGLLLAAFLWTLTLEGGSDGIIDHGDHTHVDPMAGESIPVRWALLPACLLLTFAALMLQALALFCALRLAVVPTLSICGGAFLLGLMSDYLLAARAATALWARALYVLLPNWQHFWMADAMTGGGEVPWGYVAHAAVYAGAWTLGMLLLALGSFERMEVR
jgi:ABC-type transport system involved in multi-copper enzyme maturation permease subunit